MTGSSRKPVTRLSRHDDKKLFIREHDVAELMGRASFTDVLILDILGHMPSDAERVIVDACLVGLIEHGLSPSALAARLTYTCAPESLQGAVCAGLAGVGDTLVGSIENSARLLDRLMTEADDMPAAASRIAEEHRDAGKPIHGFGHPHFRPDDPRTVRLFALVEALQLPGRHVAAAQTLAAAVDAAFGKHLTMNSSMGMAAALCEIGFPIPAMRGLAVICRSAGLVAHVLEEMRDPVTWAVYAAAQDAVDYEADTRPSAP